MSSRQQIRVANDNGPAMACPEPAAPATDDNPSGGLNDLVTLPALPEPISPPKRRAPRRSIGRTVALLYQGLATALTGLGLAQGVDPYAVGGLSLLAAMGGMCALVGWSPSRFGAHIAKETCGVVAAFCLILAAIVVAPTLFPPGLQDPLVLGALGFAAVAALFSLRACTVLALGGLLMIALVDPLPSIPTALAVQAGAIFALCCMAARRAGSRLLGAALASSLMFAMWLVLSQSGLHPAQSLGTLVLAAAALWAAALTNGQRLAALGLVTTLGAAMATQIALIDPASSDDLLQSAAPIPLLAGLLVALQGTVLGFNLLRWLSGRLGWLGVVLPQIVLAAGATLILDPTALERVTRIPVGTDIPSVIRIGLGAVVLGIAGLSLYRAWLADRPLKTGLFAMIAMIQIGLLWPVVSSDMTLGAVGLSLAAAALCGAILSRGQARLQPSTAHAPMLRT